MAQPQDAEASLRAQLASHVDGAQADIDRQLAQLQAIASRGGDTGALALAQSQQSGLSRLQQRIANADIRGLASMRGEVAASVAVVQELVRQAQTNSPSAVSAAASLQQANEAARGSVSNFMHAYYDNRIFDPYLKFASAEDEQEYRKREAERQRDIEKAMAENTPEATLRASRLAIEQLKDAGAHGADRSPDYQPTLDNLETRKHDLEHRIGQQPVAPGTERSQEPLTPADAASALRAAGVSLADASDTPHVVPTKGATQIGRA